MIDNKTLRETLVEKYDYMESKVDGVVEKISKFSPKVMESFEKWFNTGEVDSIEVEGFTIKDILDKKKMTIVSAYITLDWLHRDPKQAKAALNSAEFKNSAVNRK